MRPVTESKAAGTGNSVRAGAGGTVTRYLPSEFPSGAGALQDRPLPHRLLDRGKRAAQQDRACDHRAARNLALKDVVGPNAEHRRLQEKTEGLGNRPERARPVVRRHALGQRIIALAHPAFGHRAAQTLGQNHLASRARLVGETVGGLGRHLGQAHPMRRGELVYQCKHHDDQPARHGKPAQHRVEQEDRRDEDRRPGHVHEGQQHRRGKEALDSVEIAQRRRGHGLFLRVGAPAQRRIEDAGIEPGLESRAHPRHDPSPSIVEQGHQAIKPGHQDRQRDQCLDRARMQHPVIDLKHVERSGQHQQVDENAEDKSPHQKAAPLASGRAQFFGPVCRG